MTVTLYSFIPTFFIIAIILRTITCYYVRYWYRRYLTFHPSSCNTKNYICNEKSIVGKLERKTYTGDGKLFYLHKYFIWTTIFLLPFHIKEVIPIFVHSFSTGMVGFKTIDVSLELAYLLFGTLFAVSCHSVKYFFDKRGQCEECVYSRKTGNALAKLNLKHGLFLGITLGLIAIRFAFLLAYGINFLTAMQMLFVRMAE